MAWDDTDSDNDGDAAESAARLYEAHRGRWPRVFLFVGVLAVMFSLYLYNVVGMTPGDRHTTTTLGRFLLNILLVIAIAAVPFAVMAWFNFGWHSRHAAWIAGITWVGVWTAFSIKWGANCPGAAAFLFIPISIGAVIGHNIGLFGHPEQFTQDELDR